MFKESAVIYLAANQQIRSSNIFFQQFGYRSNGHLRSSDGAVWIDIVLRKFLKNQLNFSLDLAIIKFLFKPLSKIYNSTKYHLIARSKMSQEHPQRLQDHAQDLIWY